MSTSKYIGLSILPLFLSAF
jgi:hypothetical protein